MRVPLTPRRLAAAAAALAVSCAVGGCQFTGLSEVPLPGGADLGSHPYHVTVMFRDVLDLVPQAAVKVNDVAVGKVTDIGLGPDGWTAKVGVEVNGAVVLPANAEAELRQSSLLGEKYVELRAPTGAPPQGRLRDGAVIGLARTGRTVQVEEVLGALSLLLNGGGLEKLRTIAHELNTATSGNEAQLRDLLTQVGTLTSGLDAQRSEIGRALDSLNRLSATLDTQRGQIARVIDGLGPGLAVLEQERHDLVGMLQALDRLSGVATDVVNRSHADLVADLDALQPVLGNLAEAGDTLPKALQLLLTFPFTDQAANAVKGDYTNLYARLDLDLTTTVRNLTNAASPIPPDVLPGAPSPPEVMPGAPIPPEVMPGAPSQPGTGTPQPPLLPLLPGLPGLPRLPGGVR